MTEQKTTPDFLAQDVADLGAIEQQIKNEGAPPQEPPAQQAEPQQQPQVEDDDKTDGEDRGQFIRKEALYNERKARKEATERSRTYEKQLEEERRRFTDFQAKANERLAQLFKDAQQPQPKTPEIQIPDLDKDPLGHFQAKDQIRERELNELREWRKSQEQRTQEQAQAEQVQAEVGRLEHQFAQSTPDYWDAQAHLAKVWAEEAQAIGFDPREAVKARIMETINLGVRLNKNPAEVAYTLAKARGYAQQAKPNGHQQPAPQQPKPSGPSLDTLERGISASKSPSATPGMPAAGTPSIDAILALSDEEFAAKYVKTEEGQKAWAREMQKHLGIT